jgi:putative membrane protein
MDGIIEDTRREVLTLLAEWQKAQGDDEDEGLHLGGMFS